MRTLLLFLLTAMGCSSVDATLLSTTSMNDCMLDGTWIDKDGKCRLCKTEGKWGGYYDDAGNFVDSTCPDARPVEYYTQYNYQWKCKKGTRMECFRLWSEWCKKQHTGSAGGAGYYEKSLDGSYFFFPNSSCTGENEPTKL
jgi:hypothetical protein